MGYLIIWILICVIAGNIYKNKGRKYWRGFAVGALLGPLGIVLALASSGDSAGKAMLARSEEEKEVFSGVKKRCVSCDEVIASKAKKCKHCGEEQ